MFDQSTQPYEEPEDHQPHQRQQPGQTDPPNTPTQPSSSSEPHQTNSPDNPVPTDRPTDLFGEPVGPSCEQDGSAGESALSGPVPSWRVTDPADALSASMCEINRAHVRLARSCTPDMDDCVSDVQTRLSVRLGLPEYRALTLIEIGLTFERFPSLVELGNRELIPWISGG